MTKMSNVSNQQPLQDRKTSKMCAMPMCNANENDPLKNVFNIVGIRYALVPVFDPTCDTGGGARAPARP